MEALEGVLGSVSFLEKLRPDEIGRVARRFEIAELAAGEARRFDAEGSRLVVVVEGRARVAIESAHGAATSALEPGEHHGELGLLTGRARAFTVTARGGAARLALLDRAGLDGVLEDAPIVAEALAREVASELAAVNEASRELVELDAVALPADEIQAALDAKRREVASRRALPRRLSPGALFRRLVTDRGAEPPFWMLAGFFVSLGGARLVVALILKYGLEKRLFALVPGNDPNPMHVHHFNYGLVLVGMAGLAALLPFGRRALRVLAFAFGAGAGLVFDEFGLFWNLNPEYAQASSLIAAAMAAVVLAQLVWFRDFWAALGRRAWLSLGGAR
jgi:CRP-like cAMP-binding protein